MNDTNQVLSVSQDELDLITAFLYVVRLGSGTTYSAAALSLLDKLSKQTDGTLVMDNAYEKVNMRVQLMNNSGDYMNAISSGMFEFIV